jgi:hypothetical protein
MTSEAGFKLAIVHWLQMIVRLQSACSCLVKDKVVIVVCDGKCHNDVMRVLQHPAQQKGSCACSICGKWLQGVSLPDLRVP